MTTLPTKSFCNAPMNMSILYIVHLLHAQNILRKKIPSHVLSILFCGIIPYNIWENLQTQSSRGVIISHKMKTQQYPELSPLIFNSDLPIRPLTSISANLCGRWSMGLKLEGSLLSLIGGVWLCKKGSRIRRGTSNTHTTKAMADLPQSTGGSTCMWGGVLGPPSLVQKKKKLYK